MSGIFINYRREDSGGHAGRVYESLVGHFGRSLVFMDIFDIPPGKDFALAIDQRISNCDVLLVMIGKRWVSATDQAGRRRLIEPNDFVRLEIDAALRRNVRVIPVLVGGAGMPTQDLLPDSITQLATLNALVIYDDLFRQSISRLIALVATSVKVKPSQISSYLREHWRKSPARVLFWTGVASIASCCAFVLTIEHWQTPDGVFASAKSAVNVILAPDLMPPPFIAALPPIIPAAAHPQLAEDCTDVEGPRHPRLFLRISLQARDELRLEAVGGDGTLYISSRNPGFWAVREGKMRFGYQVGSRDFHAAIDGRVWFGTELHVDSWGREYYDGVYFNRDGQGGILRGHFPTQRYKASYPVDLPSVSPRQKLTHDRQCAFEDCFQMVTDSSGIRYVQTNRRLLFAADSNGSKLWTYTMPCTSQLMLAQQGSVTLSCQESVGIKGFDLFQVRGGRLRWRVASLDKINQNMSNGSTGFSVDRTGTLYFTTTGERSQLYALNHEGEQQWVLNLGQFEFSSLQLDPRGRLFLAGTIARDNPRFGASLSCFADSGCD
jgi:TIR domain